MVVMTVLAVLCTPKILPFEHRARKFVRLKFMGRTGWKGERTTSTLNTAVVPLLIVYLHPSSVVRVGCVGNPVQPTIHSWCCRRKTIPRNQNSESTNNFLKSHHERKQGPEYVR